MATIRFEHADVDLEIEVGARLIDLTDDHPEADVPYSCRSANCGTCRLVVCEGMDAFAPPEDDELEVLAIFGDGPETRLGCQLRVVNASPARIRVRLAD